MGLESVGDARAESLERKIARLVDFGRDLPDNMFLNKNMKYWFFERPILNTEIFAALIGLSYSVFKADVFVRFAQESGEVGKYFFLDGRNVEASTGFISSGFDDFFGSTVNYPVVVSNLAFDWIAYESSKEELGVVGVVASVSPDLVTFLDDNFMSCSELFKLSLGESTLSGVSKVLTHSFL